MTPDVKTPALFFAEFFKFIFLAATDAVSRYSPMAVMGILALTLMVISVVVCFRERDKSPPLEVFDRHNRIWLRQHRRGPLILNEDEIEKLLATRKEKDMRNNTWLWIVIAIALALGVGIGILFGVFAFNAMPRGFRLPGMEMPIFWTPTLAITALALAIAALSLLIVISYRVRNHLATHAVVPVAFDPTPLTTEIAKLRNDLRDLRERHDKLREIVMSHEERLIDVEEATERVG